MAYEKVTLYGVPIVAKRAGQLRPHRPRGRPRPVPAPRPGARATWDTHHAFFAAQPRAAGRGRGARRAGPAHRRRRRRRDALRLLRRPRPRRRRLRPALRQLVEADPPDLPRPADLRPRPADRPAGRARRLPGRLRAGAGPAAAGLPLRAGRPRRRRHRRGAAGVAEPGRPDGARVAGAGAARGARRRAHQEPAEEPAGAGRAGAELREGVPRRRAALRAADPGGAGRRPAPAHRGADRAGRLGPGQGAGAPAPDLPGGRRRRPAGGAGPGPRRPAPPARPAADARRCRRRPASLERSDLRSWDVGTLPRTFEGGPVRGYPALVDEGASVGVKVLPDAAAQDAVAPCRHPTAAAAHRAGAGQGRRRPARPTPQKLALARNPHGSVPALLDDCSACAVDALLTSGGGPVWDEAAFAALRDHVRAGLHDTLLEVVTVTERVLAAAAEVEAALAELRGQAALEPALDDVRAQLVGARRTPASSPRPGCGGCPDLRRYLTAVRPPAGEAAAGPAPRPPADARGAAARAGPAAGCSRRCRPSAGPGRTSTPSAG